MTEQDMEIQVLRRENKRLIKERNAAIKAREKTRAELLAENIQLRAERDAAIGDLIKYASCDACKFSIIVDEKREDYEQALKKCRGCKPTDCRFEWRGVQDG